MNPPSSRPSWIAADLRGGIVSALVAIPLAMGFGMFAFVALGEAYFGHGVLAGLWSAFIAGVVCVLTGNRSTTVYAPRVTTTFYLGSVLFALARSPVPGLQEGGLPLVLAVFMGIVFLGGLFQALFGLVRLGSLIKFTPYPVMAGFQNAAALLLLLVQASTLLGMPVTTGFTEVPSNLGQAHPLTLVVAAVAVLVMWQGKRWFPRVPAVLLGLAAGTLAWYALAAFGFRSSLGPVIGDLPEVLRPLEINALWSLLPAGTHWPLAWVMVPAALGLAFIASLDALLCERLLANGNADPRESDRQLVRLGLGNMVAALAGGITAGVNIGPSTLNRAQGARGASSVLVNALVILATLLFLLPLVGLLPRVALSAVIAVIAIQHFDKWTLEVLRRARAGAGQRRRGLLQELGVVFVVMLLSVTVNIVAAVFIGVLIAVGLFLLRMSRSVVRRHYRCDEVRSHQSRDALSMNLLARHGARIAVFELEGPLFFGSSEALARTVREVAGEESSAVILDFRRVSDLDSTGGRVLLQLKEDLADSDCSLRISGLRSGDAVAGAMADLGLAAAAPDLDRAIEAAEDDLLASLRPATADPHPITFDSLELVRNFDARERALLRGFFVGRRFAAGATVFTQGDFGTELFLVMQGRATATLHRRGAEPLRLATFAPGATIGELALLDSGPRSATVVADGPLVCLVLSAALFKDMQTREPAIAIRLLVNLGREMGFRMRRANQMLHRLAA